MVAALGDTLGKFLGMSVNGTSTSPSANAGNWGRKARPPARASPRFSVSLRVISSDMVDLLYRCDLLDVFLARHLIQHTQIIGHSQVQRGRLNVELPKEHGDLAAMIA